MKKRSKRVISVLSVILAVLLLIPALAAPASAATADEFVQLINAERAKHDLPALNATNSGLQAAARVRADESAVKFDGVSHKRPDGRIWHTVLKEKEVTRYSTAGETLAAGITAPEDVLATWLNNSADRANILSKEFTHIGVGIYEGKFTLVGDEEQEGLIVALEFIAESKYRHPDTISDFEAFFLNLYISFVNAWNKGITWIKDLIGLS